MTPFITLVIGYYALNESMKSLEILNMFVSFAGVVFIVYFSSHDDSKDRNSSHVSTFDYLLGIFANALSAAIFAVINVILRYLKDLNYVALSSLNGLFYMVTSPIILLVYRSFVNQNNF